jgi:hypothetical protein
VRLMDLPPSQRYPKLHQVDWGHFFLHMMKSHVEQRLGEATKPPP